MYNVQREREFVRERVREREREFVREKESEREFVRTHELIYMYNNCSLTRSLLRVYRC
jgi:hypothetical protein